MRRLTCAAGIRLTCVTSGGLLACATVARIAGECGRTVDVCGSGRYLVTYCGTHGGGMHQVSFCGWCHDCRKAGDGYVDDLDYETELAVLQTRPGTTRY